MFSEGFMKFLMFLLIVTLIWSGSMFVTLATATPGCLDAGFIEAIGYFPTNPYCIRIYNATEYICRYEERMTCEVPWR